MTESGIYEDAQQQRDADSLTLARILDVLYLQLWDSNKELAQKVIDKHAAGGLIGPNVTLDPEELL